MATEITPDLIQTIQARVAGQGEPIVQFMRAICAIPSIMGNIGAVGKRVISEMDRLGFEDTRSDKMGNVLGRVGNGRKILLYDSHLDTVDVGDRSDWEWDPFEGKVENGILYAGRLYRVDEDLRRMA